MVEPNPRLSVVVPVYNEERTIGACLDTVLAQDEPVHEVIVVNNNSTDGTLRVLAGYGDRVTVLDEPRQGVQHARNTGMDAASGELIGRIDADTRLTHDWARSVRKTFEDATVQAVTGPASYYDVALAPLVSWGDAAFRWAWSRRMDWIFGANMAIRAAAWRSVRGSLCVEPDVHEDLDLGIHLYAAGLRIAYEPQLRAGTSGRRIADRFTDYRAYMLMTELGYRKHRALAARGSYARAWLTTRALLVLYPALRLLYAARTGTAPRRLSARKNPMAERTAPAGTYSLRRSNPDP